MLSHHEDVYDSLAKRTWIILHVHELWNGGKPMDAIKTCIEQTGMADVEKDLGTTCSGFSAPYTLLSRDYALFLNILQQLPSSCSMWTLDLCVLVLPKLKEFMSTQHHTSHVEMACSILHVVLKKVAAVARRTSKGTKNKDKEQKVKVCTTELKEIKDLTSDVIQTVKSVKKNNTEDPGSMKSALKELQLALGTFLSSATAS
ncbi:Katanin p80 WD40 repeat-containing subunit B1 [Desmophyllum pertusum]|uniref:Katanin p80 WD40 repeat-containing subunit B1 n=1 Tax=Desmophyllum pertusum TaxID=174260 RepID=A0A9W9ZG22_9CNID|nr:Katanin p80 WD40 repeat-containing subunit B1 [Desmophyllum pertusum]